jgi:radical SAM protein with 4Fe4S-binding SPASM domain
MSVVEIRALVEQARALGCRRCIFIDADVVPHPDLNDIIADARAAEMQVELITSRSTISAERAIFLRRHDVAVAVNLDAAADASTLNNLRAAGCADVAVRVEIVPENVTTLPSIWRSIRSNGFEPHFQVAKPQFIPGQPPRVIPPDQLRQLFEELGRIDREEFGREWTAPPSLIGRACNRHLYACHIAACGTIYPCVGVTIPLGNLRIESLREILSLSEVLENLRAFEQKVKEPCGTCCKSTACYGCRGSAYQLTGDYLAGDALCWKATGTDIESLPVGIDGLIPHGESIRMAHQLVQIGEREARTEFVVPSDSFLVHSAGRLDESAYIEMIAQSFAACHGFHLSRDERAMHRGLLLGVKELQIFGDAYAGDRLEIHVRKVTRFGDFGVIDGAIRHQDGRLIATGTVKVWKPSSEAAEKAVLA